MTRTACRLLIQGSFLEFASEGPVDTTAMILGGLFFTKRGDKDISTSHTENKLVL